MVRLLVGIKNGLESEWVVIRMRNENQNKLFILSVRITIRMSYITIYVFTLFWNHNIYY